MRDPSPLWCAKRTTRAKASISGIEETREIDLRCCSRELEARARGLVAVMRWTSYGSGTESMPELYTDVSLEE